MSKKINFTVQEILEAGLADKSPKLIGYMGPYTLDDGRYKAGATCAIGGVAQVLGKDPDYLFNGLGGVRLTPKQYQAIAKAPADTDVGLGDAIMVASDGSGRRSPKSSIFRRALKFLTPEQLATKVRIYA